MKNVESQNVWRRSVRDMYILCLANLRILSFGDGGGTVQKLARGPETLIYGYDCNISGFCGIVFRLFSSGLRHGVVLSELGYYPIFHLQLQVGWHFPTSHFRDRSDWKVLFSHISLLSIPIAPGSGCMPLFPPFRGLITIYHGSCLNDLTTSSSARL
jgi:hypothetical protein